jgi:hypothetical protein
MAVTARSALGCDYAFGPAVRLRIHGCRVAARHFASEFAPQVPSAGTPDVEVHVRFGRPSQADVTRFSSGGHKTARWRVALSPADDRPLRATVLLAGGPPSFALSLVQGYFVEPLVAVALAGERYVALPSAALTTRDGAVLLMGRSGSGKSSVSMRTLARGRAVLGDDQVVLDGQGRCWPYPRRLRVYPDLRDTAPAAWTGLRRATRRSLRMRRAVRRLSRGFVAPSLAVAATELGPPPPRGPVPARHLIVVERAAEVGELTVVERDAGWATEQAREILADQRGRFLAVADERWQIAVGAVVEREVETFRSAIDGLRVEHVRVPRSWDAVRAVDALDAHLAGAS